MAKVHSDEIAALFAGSWTGNRMLTVKQTSWLWNVAVAEVREYLRKESRSAPIGRTVSGTLANGNIWHLTPMPNGAGAFEVERGMSQGQYHAYLNKARFDRLIVAMNEHMLAMIAENPQAAGTFGSNCYKFIQGLNLV